MDFSSIITVFVLVIVSPFPAPAVSQELQQPSPIEFFRAFRRDIGASVNCSVDVFRCPDGSCIKHDWLCDGDNDCREGADEDYCQNNNCSVDQFRCSSGECIRQTWVCDDDNDCQDWGDELDCQNDSEICQYIDQDKCQDPDVKRLCYNRCKPFNDPIECQRIDQDDCHEPFLKENCPNTCKPFNADDLSTHELWLHILLQLDRPYEDRLTTHRGDRNYVYYFDNEYIDPAKHGTPVIIPTIDAFTSGKGRFNKFFNYPKGRDVIPTINEPDVREAVHELYAVYKDQVPGAKGILKVAVNAKAHVNEYIHVHTLMHALINDEELKGYGLPAFYEVFPEFFSAGCAQPSPECCQMDEYPPNLTKEEWKLSYWREDADNNNFHGSWHFYNHWDNPKGLPLNHGELFYYFHNQLVARYNMERLSNELEPVTALDNWDEDYLIPQNYIPPVLTHPNYFSLTRCANMSAGPLGARAATYRTTLENAISNNKLMQSNGSYVYLANDDGIKYVGCALQRANCGDIDITLYGDPSPNNNDGIHQIGHDVISAMGCTSGVQETEPPYNVLSLSWPSIRDPIFFRWHKFIDDVFQSHKKNLPEYKLPKLALEGVSVGSIYVFSHYGEGQLFTFNRTLKMAMWYNQKTRTCINQTTVDHYPFEYVINVDYNDTGTNDIDVNVRIYMAPKPNHTVSDDITPYEKLRTQWALMDRFKYTLKHGSNDIFRDSCSSSITVPRPKSIQELSDIYKDEKSFNEYIYTFGGPSNNTWGPEQCNQTSVIRYQTLGECQSRCLAIPKDGCTAINYSPDTKICVLLNCPVPVPPPAHYVPLFQGYARITKPATCQCGLPEHLLIPRGTPEGMPYQLFVYITPRNNGQSQSSDCPNRECSDLCSKDYTSCDNSGGEAMGFPFDRPLKKLDDKNITYIEDLVEKLPNAMLHDIKIFYEKDETSFLRSDQSFCN